MLKLAEILFVMPFFSEGVTWFNDLLRGCYQNSLPSKSVRSSIGRRGFCLWSADPDTVLRRRPILGVSGDA